MYKDKNKGEDKDKDNNIYKDIKVDILAINLNNLVLLTIKRVDLLALELVL